MARIFSLWMVFLWSVSLVAAPATPTVKPHFLTRCSLTLSQARAKLSFTSLDLDRLPDYYQIDHVLLEKGFIGRSHGDLPELKKTWETLVGQGWRLVAFPRPFLRHKGPGRIVPERKEIHIVNLPHSQPLIMIQAKLIYQVDRAQFAEENKGAICEWIRKYFEPDGLRALRLQWAGEYEYALRARTSAGVYGTDPHLLTPQDRENQWRITRSAHKERMLKDAIGFLVQRDATYLAAKDYLRLTKGTHPYLASNDWAFIHGKDAGESIKAVTGAVWKDFQGELLLEPPVVQALWETSLMQIVWDVAK